MTNPWDIPIDLGPMPDAFKEWPAQGGNPSGDHEHLKDCTSAMYDFDYKINDQVRWRIHCPHGYEARFHWPE